MYLHSNISHPYFTINNKVYKNPFANFTLGGREYYKKHGRKITDVNQSAILSHELDHAINDPGMQGYIEASDWFNFPTSSDYFSKNNATELAARGTQIKDWLKISKDRNITAKELRKAAANYVSDTGLDNNMSQMFERITDFGKAAKWFSRYSSAALLPMWYISKQSQDKRTEDKRFAEGGETGESDIDFTTSLNTRLGRTPSGTPKEQGLQPAFSLRDFFDFTPVGDAVAVNDTYQAAKEGDWLGAGLAALTVLPFIPSSVKSLRKTPSVRRTGMDQIDRITKAKEKEIKMATRLNNETYNIAERLMDDPSYMRRAQQVKDKYGDDYISVYADIINAYNEAPELLPKAKGSLSLGEARGRMQTTAEATKRHKQGGDFPGMGEYEYMFDIDRGVPYGSTVHEGNHYSDFLTNQAPDAVGSNNMYKFMRSAIKPYADNMSKYFASPTEQKAYMNQLREFMYANKMISTRDEIVTPDLIKQAIGKLPKSMDSVKKAFNQFKSAKSYTKWYNTVPLLGVGAIGANRYFTDNENNKI